MPQEEQHSPDETPEERALEALRSRMARPQPKAAGEPIDAAEESSVGSGSATGFVGMLAKRQLDGDSVAGMELNALEGEAAKRSRYPLEMAREVVPPVGIEQPPLASPAPHWLYRLALPVAWGLVVLLVIIGGWAVGALIYMHQHNGNSNPPIMVPKDVTYPLIAWRYDAGPLGDYTAASRLMAKTMLLCWPVAGLVMGVAWLVRKKLRETAKHAQA